MYVGAAPLLQVTSRCGGPFEVVSAARACSAAQQTHADTQVATRLANNPHRDRRVSPVATAAEPAARAWTLRRSMFDLARIMLALPAETRLRASVTPCALLNASQRFPEASVGLWERSHSQMTENSHAQVGRHPGHLRLTGLAEQGQAADHHPRWRQASPLAVVTSLRVPSSDPTTGLTYGLAPRKSPENSTRPSPRCTGVVPACASGRSDAPNSRTGCSDFGSLAT